MSPIRIGSAEVHRVEEFALQVPMALVTEDDELITAHQAWLRPNFLTQDGTFDFTFQSWILAVDSDVIVVDPCNGNGRPHPLPMFENLDIPYLERFNATRFRPEDVDYVFCTHFHHDHCGWNTQLRNGRFVPTFPNARYLFVRREYERWDPRRPDHVEVDYNVGVFERSVEPIVEGGLADLVQDHHRISPNLVIEPAYGHTRGHSVLHLSTDDGEAYFTGDVFHHPIQMVDPSLHLPGCDDLETAIETRRQLIPKLVETQALVIPAHFPAPHAGRLHGMNDSITFNPVETA